MKNRSERLGKRENISSIRDLYPFASKKGSFFVKVVRAFVVFLAVVTFLASAHALTNNFYSKGHDKVVPPENPPVVTTTNEAVTDISSVKGSETKSLGPQIPILYYHYVEVNPDPVGDPKRNNLLITPENFFGQLLYLKTAGYTTITYDDLVAGIKNPATLPPKPIIITIDDGYTDFYANAFPILKKLGMKATIFVLSQGSKINPGFYMSSDQLKMLSQSPLITVACHTEDHMNLKGRSEVIQRKEILGCKQQLEALLGMPVRHFAYPYGSYDQTSIKLVKESGFETASTTIPGSHQDQSSLYTLKRIRVGNYGGNGLKSLLNQLTQGK
jgi:peptidoglycan/xylan/chitin deacetylase (PgdA/CDA1 family)